MKIGIHFLSVLFFYSFSLYSISTFAAAAEVQVSIIKTADLQVLESLVYQGGPWRKITNNFSAFIIKHDDDFILFDTGLGSHIDEQYKTDMVWWQRPFFKYNNPVAPAAVQLKNNNINHIDKIFLSHAHWDHASGIDDFPGTPIYINAEERKFTLDPGHSAGSPWASQISSSSIVWKEYTFSQKEYEGFPLSYDLYNDGSLVLVPLFGHTPGSVGLFVTVSSGKKYFFIGDAAWSGKAVIANAPKFCVARSVVDFDTHATDEVLAAIHELHKKKPEIIIVPAHDGVTQDSLGYFPVWLK